MKKYLEPNFRSSALITIDTQCDTLDGKPLEIPGTSAVLPHIRMVLDAYRRNKMPIVHVVRIYRKDGSNEVVIYKPRWGAFYNTPPEQSHARG